MYNRWFALAIGSLGSMLLAMGGAAHAADNIGKMILASDVSYEQAQLLKADREVFSKFRFSKKKNPGLSELLGIPSLSGTELVAWLEARIRVVIGPSFIPDRHLVRYRPGEGKYDFPNLHPIVESPPRSTHSRSAPSTGATWDMRNLTATLYQEGKQHHVVYGVDAPGVGTVAIFSPRSGVIQVGPGLFKPNYSFETYALDALPNVIYRMETFFHEARHGDGNGLSAGFYHAYCPQGHAMAGRYACDRSLNGAYAIGASMMKAMTESCKTCTVAEREVLRLGYTQFFDRVLPTEIDGVTPTRNWDPAPESFRN